jgi:hypothetical protein
MMIYRTQCKAHEGKRYVSLSMRPMLVLHLDGFDAHWMPCHFSERLHVTVTPVISMVTVASVNRVGLSQCSVACREHGLLVDDCRQFSLLVS